MLEAAWQGLVGILQPQMIGLMVMGVVLGSIVAALPGIGGVVLISISLPFAITLSPMACIAFLLGIGAITNTANTFPSVLMAVPGSAGSQATIVDGYPMAQKGQAARAFGAAYTVSAMGGIFGALVLTASLPVLRPLVLSFGSPEFFVLCLWGVSMVGVLSGRAPLKGIVVGIIGVFIAMVGLDPKSGTPRYVFDQPYLWDGVSIMITALGVFAIPETIAMVRRGGSIAQMEYGGGLMDGIKDAFRHWFLMLRCAAVGCWVGFIPGLGASVADWFAYAHAVQTEKNPEKFGTGDVRGVIAPESANNAKEGGALIPTLAFGIPGSTGLALTLVAFLAVGIDPGPKMLTEQLHLVFAMIWVLVICNLMATVLCLGLGKPMARVSFLPYFVVAPVVITLCFMAAFAANFDWLDLVSLMVVSVIGYFMKELDWPRPPMVIGVVLGEKMERYLWLSTARYGTSWLLHPTVIVLLVLLVISVVIAPIWQHRKRKKKAAVMGEG